MLRLPLFLALALSANALTWTTHGPRFGAINNVAFSASEPTRIYAISGSGVFRSDNAGDTWTSVSGPLHDVTHIAVDPTNANIVYVVAANKVWKTVDGGATWSESSSGLRVSSLPTGLLIDPKNPSTLYFSSGCAGGFEPTEFDYVNSGLYKSTDAGASWKPAQIGPSDGCVQQMGIDPEIPQHLFRHSWYAGEKESYDAASHWTPAPSNVPTHAVLADARSPLTRYGLGGQGTVKSVDGGLTWFSLGNFFNDLTIDRASSRLFGLSSAGIYRSGNGGVTWLTIDTPQPTATHIVADDGAGALFLATQKGLYRAPLATFGPWSLLNIGDGGTRISSVTTDPRNPAVVYATSYDYYASRSLADHSRVFRSDDFGKNWSVIYEADDATYYAPMAVDARGDLIVARNNPKLLRIDATTGAATRIDLRDSGYAAIAADPHDASTFHVAAYSGIWTTHDGGVSFRLFPMLVGRSVVVAPDSGAIVYAGSQQGAWKSTDGGNSWTQIASEWTDRLALAPSKPSTVYRIAHDMIANYGALYRSDNSGATWTQLRWPAERLAVNAIVVDPRDARSLWIASSSNGVYHSTDSGATWQQESGLPSAPVDLTIDRDGAMIHAATMAYGVWDAPVTRHRRAATR